MLEVPVDTMFPLDPTLLLFVKFFVVFTCVFFWIRLAYYHIMDTSIRKRSYRVGEEHRHRS